MSVARALYDFEGDASNGELSFQAGDMIDITAQVGSLCLVALLWRQWTVRDSENRRVRRPMWGHR